MAFAGQSIARSESDLALEVKSGRAEAAFGLKSEAVAQNLDFIPIMTERLDLLIWRKVWFDTAFQKFLEFQEFRIQISRISRISRISDPYSKFLKFLIFLELLGIP